MIYTACALKALNANMNSLKNAVGMHTRFAQGIACATLRGMMCFNGRRYCGFFYDAMQRLWQWFDDCTLSPVGDEWDAVIAACSQSRYQPLFLFYGLSPSESYS